ncbi:trypsin-like peptidase domain-containing protein [Hydrogenophaga sp.]|uniref:trypsin-like peptidase domain-containing protein n=1 Tax=Hydrogenophaga sp. TaxID=1904254 RepID=UPI0026134C16|nr:trypsin-like peptidase domain-containing protein [Hydrogenophaga sp.]
MKKAAKHLAALALLACALAVPAAEPTAAAPALPGGLAPNHRAIVELAGPAVVGVDVVGMRIPPASVWTPGDNAPAWPPMDALPFRAQGSGFIISSDGLLLTSAHVIEGARRITVRLSDRRQFQAQLVGSDPTTDVAVLRVNAQALPVVRLGRSSRLQVGDPVVVIGSPFGLEQSVSQGIVSALGRALPGLAAVPHIQTDASVNPGHSGGPLLDASASVVGINSQIYTLSGGYEGLSFAVPIDVALRVKDQIVAHGRMLHGYLGVTIQNLDLTLASAFGLDRPRGALVAATDAGSAADQGGLRAGDVIIAFNGEPLGQAGELTSHLGLTAPGERVRLTVWRDQQATDLTVRLDQAMDLALENPIGQAGAAQARVELGWQLRILTAQERSVLGVVGGLWVEQVSGLTAQAGLRAGDALLSINLRPVHTLEDVRLQLRERPLNAALLVDRDGERQFIPLLLD